MNKNVERNILKLTHKSLYDDTFPEYLRLNVHKVSDYSLRSSTAPVLSIPRVSGTFQHSAANIFNKLPVAIRNITEYNSFCRSVKRHLSCKELTLSSKCNCTYVYILYFYFILFGVDL